MKPSFLKSPLFLFLSGFSFTIGLLGQNVVPTDKTKNAAAESDTASPNVETLSLESKIFHNSRSVRILIPPGYRDSSNTRKRYPVMYFNDGNMFFSRETFGLEEIVRDLIQKQAIPPVLIVGIDSGAVTDKAKNQELDRADEYIPYPDTGFPPDHILLPAEVPNPHGKFFPEFLLKEVMPLINERYRTLTGPENTGLGGFSYGAVAALYVAMSRPNTIGRLLLESTPLWIGPDNQLIKEATRVKQWPAAIYMGLGSKEGDDDQSINKEGQKNQDVLSHWITEVAPKTRVNAVFEEGARHRPPAWRRRLPNALIFLWGQ